MSRWTEDEYKAWEREHGRRVGALGARNVPAPSGGQAPEGSPPRARGNKKTLGESATSKAAELLAHQLNELMRLGAIREYHMANIDSAARGWRFDFGFPDVKVLVEVHGALGSGKHSRKAGQSNDLEKANAAGEHGWSVLAYSTAMVTSGVAALQVERTVLARRKELLQHKHA